MNAKKEESKSLSVKALLTLTALGVVYGDIGTSPLYVMKESFLHNHFEISQLNVYGILSLVFWSLILVISVKYLGLLLIADNKGEGGILALTGLVTPENERAQSKRKNLIRLGLFGTALIYGDGMVTPAISVLSAVEGLELISPSFKPFIIPLVIGILVGVFSVQKYGTEKVGKAFGPITLFWFIIIGALGLSKIIENPHVLMAINPIYAVKFFIQNQWPGFLVLGSVFLVITGGEALYSDLGHFGIKPIRRAWFYIVLPCLLLNYFGQGALLLENPLAVKNPFYLMAPSWMLTPLVILATAAAIIASQALITGIFSITTQAVQWGYFPRVLIEHTSEKEIGQIYVKSMNRALMVACILLVLFFKTSSNLAAAYGIAVTSTMAITTLLFYFVLRHNWRWSKLKSMAVCGGFLIIDLGYWIANVLKVLDGGWVILAVAAMIFTMMTTWKKGRRLLALKIKEELMPMDEFLKKINNEKPFRNPGIAVYMSGSLTFAPYALIKNFKHYKSLHEDLVFLSVITEPTPRVAPHRRVEVVGLGDRCYRINVRYGYIERPNIPREIDGLILEERKFNSNEATFFIGKERLFATHEPGMALWRERLFAWLMLNAQDATTFFQLPRKRVMEVGVHIEL